MDEIEWMKKLKKSIIFICKIVFILILFFELMGLLGLFINGNNSANIIGGMLIFLVIGFAIIFSLLILLFILNLLYKVIYRGNKLFIWEKEYIRDFPKDCSPALSSLLYNLKIDVYKDYTATILELYLKKYINIIHSNDEYKFEVCKENNEFLNLMEHEKYVLSCITSKNKFDENKFKQLIINDAQNYGFITNKKYINLNKLMIIFITPLILIVSYFINQFLFFTLLTIVLSLLLTIGMMHKVANSENIVLHLDTNYKRTKKGKEKTLQISALKQFIHDYTLIKDKNIEHIQILEEYIPYATSLDEANNIEDFIKNNDIYRHLIYPNLK